jgi:hypothetical protein
VTESTELPLSGTGGELPLHAAAASALPWTSRQVRDEIESYLARDLLGPWQGPEEELPYGSTPSERYIVGVLCPARTMLEAEVTSDSAAEDGTGEGATEVTAAAAAGSMMPASMGLSFSLDPATTSLRVRATWGRYEVAPSASQLTDSGVPHRVWCRREAGGEIELDVVAGESSVAPDPERPRVLLRSRSRLRGAVRIIDLALVDCQSEPERSRDEARLYQAQLSVTAADLSSPVFLAHNDPAHVVADETAPTADPERLGLDLLYRDCRQFAVGRNVAVEAEQRPAEPRSWRLTTTWLPSFDIGQTVAPDPAEIPGFDPRILDMRYMATAERSSVVAGLHPLHAAYRLWLDDQEARVNAEPDLAAHRVGARSHLAGARRVAARLEAGITLLAEDDQAWEAWKFANSAMALQRAHTEIAAMRQRDSSVSLAAAAAQADAPQRRSWRPFQLAFVLLNLPSLTDPTHPDRAQTDAEDGPGLVDLLFFPTGGGKTEAYLGLTAYALAIRRLQGVVGEGDEARDGRAGVTVLMRYTLRLLTAQQYQRAATLICAAEHLRREAALAAEAGGARNPWGDVPFRIGLWVGAHVTPNWYEDAREAITALRGHYADAPTNNPVQLLRCPWCTRELMPGQDVECDDARRRTLLWCGDPDGDCPFSRRQSARWQEGLPVVTVDEEIFRLCPSLVIGTVDKFAQLPLRGYTGLLFGLAASVCERHGYRHDDLTGHTECRSGHPRRGDWPATQPQRCLPLRPPDLIVQDELHLISGALGTMVALYETAVDRLASWSVGGRRVRPKVVASTATVRRAKEQVHCIFARDLAIFPPPIIDAGETFFSRQVAVDEDHAGRRYLGVCAHGQRLKQVQIRVAQILLAAAQLLFDEHGAQADPYMTLVDYFSSRTELAGMRRLVDDDIATRLRQQDRRGLRNRPTPQVRELTSRISSQEIGRSLGALEISFDPDIDSTAARERRLALLREKRSTHDEVRRRAATTALDALLVHPPEAQPVDVVLATSMLQVGVDVPRLGLMVVTGQPKGTAEYIQATSRIGRDPERPGLVVTVYNWARPRDLAHFETFTHFHRTAYARVEALSATPFAARALDRGLTGVLVSAIRHARHELEPEDGAQAVGASDPDVTRAVEWISSRAHEVTSDTDTAEDLRRRCRELLDDWDRRRRGLESGTLAYTADGGGRAPLLETRPGRWERWSTPWSLREVEPEVNLLIDVAADEVRERPVWSFAPPSPSPEAEEGGESDEALPVDEMGIIGTPMVNPIGGPT